MIEFSSLKGMIKIDTTVNAWFLTLTVELCNCIIKDDIIYSLIHLELKNNNLKTL